VYNCRVILEAGPCRSSARSRGFKNARTLPSVAEVGRFQAAILDWYPIHGREFPWRRSRLSPYKLIVTEILLQRTRAETVASFYDEFFRHFPSWSALAQASEAAIGIHLRPIGLWRRRAIGLSRLAGALAPRRGQVPRDRSKVEELPAVGQYIANAIKLLVHGQPAPLLDGGMARLLERHFGPRQLADIRYDPYLQTLAHDIVAHANSVELNWALLDIAAVICHRKQPACRLCPVQHTCRFNRLRRLDASGTHADEYPRPT
jgi:A/G-specific adenine glycosylase